MFEDLRDAGVRLAAAVAEHPLVRDAERRVVLAIPRGGLPAGAEVARAIDAPLDVIVVRKVRAPHNPELGLGAVGSDGHVQIDRDLVARLGISEAQLEAEIADRRAAVEERLARYRAAAPVVDVSGAVAVVVDDGVATGGTARQACEQARRQGASAVLLAVPVGPSTVRETLGDVTDALVVLSTPPEFLAVGQAYRDFSQPDEDGVVEILRATNAARSRRTAEPGSGIR